MKYLQFMTMSCWWWHVAITNITFPVTNVTYLHWYEFVTIQTLLDYIAYEAEKWDKLSLKLADFTLLSPNIIFCSIFDKNFNFKSIEITSYCNPIGTFQ